MENKKIDLNSIIQKMNAFFDGKEVTEIEKVRFLYLELGKMLHYDINMRTSDGKKFDKLYSEDVDCNNITKNSYTCVQISKIFSSLLIKAGIYARAVKDESAEDDDWTPHMYTKVYLEDCCFAVDLMRDLPYIQTNRKTRYFPIPQTVQGVKLDDDVLYEMDKKNGYLNYGQYMDYFIDMVRDDMNNSESMEDFAKFQEGEFSENLISRYKFKFISKFIHLKDLGFVEGNGFLSDLYEKFFSLEERKNIRYCSFTREYEPETKKDKFESKGIYILKMEDDENEYY